MIRHRSMRKRVIRVLPALLLIALGAGSSDADSGLSLLSGFDRARVEQTYPPENQQAVAELAKLVYRIQQVDTSLPARASEPTASNQPGDVVRFEGVFESARAIALPADLVEFLEFTQLYLSTIRSENESRVLVTSRLPRGIASGDRVDGVGIVVEVARRVEDVAANDNASESNPTRNGSGDPVAIAASAVAWYPRTHDNQGWTMLRDHGVDIGLLGDVGKRNRKPLTPDDSDAFYAMLHAAADIHDEDLATYPAPETIQPLTLLKQPESMTGQWLRMDLEARQITRVVVEDPARQAQLGSDHYYQIDAFGDLGNVIVKVTDASGAGPAVEFENRYPVSVVIRALPGFLAADVDTSSGGPVIGGETRRMIRVDGFFFRLWSYPTDFMSRQGGGEQFGPLLIAARISDRQTELPRGAGIGVLSWLIAAAVFGGIGATWIWHRRVSAVDREIRRKRSQGDASTIDWPS